MYSQPVFAYRLTAHRLFAHRLFAYRPSEVITTRDVSTWVMSSRSCLSVLLTIIPLYVTWIEKKTSSLSPHQRRPQVGPTPRKIRDSFATPLVLFCYINSLQVYGGRRAMTTTTVALELWDVLTTPFDVDHRPILWKFSVPARGRFGLVACDLQFWLVSFVLLSAECLLNCAFAAIIYKCIVPYQRTTRAYLVGYGAVLPMIVVSPFVILDWWCPLSNVAFLLCLVGGTASLILLRCVEAMHGTLPAFAQTSLASFMLYYASALQFQMDEKTGRVVPVTRHEMQRKLVDFASNWIRTGLLYSLLLPVGYKLLDAPPMMMGILWDLFHWRNIFNNFLMACLTSLVLESGAVGLGILTSMISGWSVIEIFDNPLTRSESPSDFWSKRWNRITQSGLRRGVYLPFLQSGLSRSGAAFGTFMMSGILHEYVLAIMKRRRGKPNNPTSTPFDPKYGNHFYFFLWCGIVMWLEKLTRRTTPIIWMQKHLPRPIRTALVLLTVLPIVHLFTDEYIASSFYSDAAFGFFKIVHLG